jgi:hypothetical protein
VSRRRVAAYVPDLMDRSRLPQGVTVVPDLVALIHAAADVMVLDLSRPLALEAVASLAVAGRTVIGYCPHVDRQLMSDALMAGCTEVLARSEFFRKVADLLA